MNITIYRYQIVRANWDWQVLREGVLESIATELEKLPFYGTDEESQFGFTQIKVFKNYIIGLFIQKYTTSVINYHPETKAEIKGDVIDSGEYFFVLDLINRVIYLQAKKSKDLPDRKEVNRRFKDQLIVVLERFNLIFNDIEETKDEANRDKIVEIFYNVADKVLEVDLRDLDRSILEREKRKRGGMRQTYFNPIEEYQEAMEAGAIRLALNAQSAHIKAKEGGSLKKDPITRAALESARKPAKIVYTKESKIQTEFGTIESKTTVTIGDDSFNLADPQQVATIMSHLRLIDLQNQPKLPKGGKDLFNQELEAV